MANWQSFKNGVFWYKGKNGGYPQLNKYYLEFEYDAADQSPTHVKCRATFRNSVWGNTYGSDYFYLYFPNDRIYVTHNKSKYTQNFMLHDGNDRRIPLQAKITIDGVSYNEFYLFKEWNDDKFEVPEFWICCQGRQGTLGKFNVSFFLPGGGRTGYYTDYPSGMAFYDGYTPASLKESYGKLTIKDNGDNSIKVNCTLPKAAYPEGANASTYKYPNRVEEANLYLFIKDNTNDNQKIQSEKIEFTGEDLRKGSLEKDITISLPYYRKIVTADLYTYGTYDNPPLVEYTTDKVYYYTNPTLDGELILSYDTQEPKIYSIFEINWNGKATQGNAVSPIAGYEVKVYNKNYSTLLKTYDVGSGITSIKFTSNENQDITVTNIDKLDIKGEDTIYATVQAYAVNGKQEKLYSTKSKSDEITLEDMGAVNFTLYGTWKRGYVYIYLNDSDGWVKAEDVYVYTPQEEWKRSI